MVERIDIIKLNDEITRLIRASNICDFYYIRGKIVLNEDFGCLIFRS